MFSIKLNIGVNEEFLLKNLVEIPHIYEVDVQLHVAQI